MISVLLVLLLSAHLICLNVAAAGPLVCIVLDSLSGKRDGGTNRAGQWLAWKVVQLALWGAFFGLAMGWLKWSAEYAAILRRFEARIGWGIAEFAFSVLLFSVYAVWLAARPRATRLERWGRSIVAVLAATNLLYHFPPLFALIAHSAAGRLEPVTVDSPTFRRLITTGEVVALTAHFAAASLAIAGMALVLFQAREREDESGNSAGAAILGSRLAFVATLAQVPIGFWLVMSVPPRLQQRLLGGDLLGTVLFGASMVAFLSLLHQLASVALGDTSATALRRPVWSMLFVVVAMTGLLYRLNLP